MASREKFLQIYANLPLSVRSEIIVVIEHEPISWSAAKIEIENDTPKSRQILDQLSTLGILK